MSLQVTKFSQAVKAVNNAVNALVKQLTIQKLNLDVHPHAWSEEELQEFADDLSALTSGDTAATVKKLFGELRDRHAEVRKMEEAEEAEKKKAEAQKKAEAEKKQAEAIAKAQDMVALMKNLDPAALKVIEQHLLDSIPKPKLEKKKQKTLEQQPAPTADQRPTLPDVDSEEEVSDDASCGKATPVDSTSTTPRDSPSPISVLMTPSGKEPSGDKPSGDKPSGKKPSGKKPSGKKPRTKKPSMSTKEWITEFKAAMLANKVINSTNKPYVSLDHRLTAIKKLLTRFMKDHGIQKYTVTTTDNDTLDNVVKHCYDKLVGYKCFAVDLDKDPKEAKDKQE